MINHQASIIRYSKDLSDIVMELGRISDKENYIVGELAKIKRRINDEALERKTCLLCKTALVNAELFMHQGLEMYHCSCCGHIQTRYLFSEYVIEMIEQYLPFDEVYPQLTQEQYDSRKNRVYRPKVDWLMDVIAQKGYFDPVQVSFLEIGSGYGLTLSAVEDCQVKQAIGFERNLKLVELGQPHLRQARIVSSDVPLDEVIVQNSAQCILAIFVLEHVDDLYAVAQALRNAQSGTLFYMAVPVFGFATVLENAVQSHAPRNLDGVIHNQIFTDKSIDAFLKMADYDLVGKWIFGQDMMDLSRMLGLRACGSLPVKFREQVEMQLNNLINPLQEVIDQQNFADSRHIIAVKR